MFFFAGETLDMVIFRGTGKRISAHEKAQWDPRVTVAFQPRAWFDDGPRDIFTDEYVQRCCLCSNALRRNL